ncbi:MAG: serine hydrolase [Gemmatimonadetes bacterium]|nr:serine hydrolase [Gemmatimonadota bacterium]
MGRTDGVIRRALTWAAILGASLSGPAMAQTPTAEQREHAAALGAHHICAGVFVVGRDYQRSPGEVLAQDLARFRPFLWQESFAYTVDRDAHVVTVTGPGISPRKAKYNDDQGCTILPPGEDDVYFTPVNVSSTLPNGSTQDWPLGDRNAVGPVPSEVNEAALNRALDWAMAQSEQNTRAIVVVYKGRVLGERYAPGFTKDTPQISWSMGKSITSALIGVLVQQGHFHWNDAAPVSEWSKPGDPRSQITIAHLLRMSSGLDFKNYGFPARGQPTAGVCTGRGVAVQEQRSAHPGKDCARDGRGPRRELPYLPATTPLRQDRRAQLRAGD